MRKTIRRAAAVAAAAIASLVLSGCPIQPSYPATITPIYAATGSGGLFVYNGSTWTEYTNANTGGGLKSSTVNSVVVSGSGTGALVFAGGDAGVSQFDGTAWAQLSGLGAVTVNSLALGSNLYAATSGGFSILNADGSWTNNSSLGSPINRVFLWWTYTFVAADSGLYVYNGTSLTASHAPATIVPGGTKVTAVLVDSYMDIFAGTNNGLGISVPDQPFSADYLPLGTYVYDLFSDTIGNLYIATDGGLYVNFETTPQGFSDMPALCVFVDGAGTIYAGTAGGLRVSTDGGSTWTMELEGQEVRSVATTAPLYSF